MLKAIKNCILSLGYIINHKKERGNNMFRIWAKIFKENRMLKDTVIENNNSTNRTKKVLDAIDAICKEFDLSNPLWLENNITEFKIHDKVRFNKSSCS